MKEEYLHYIFKTKQLGKQFITTNGKQLEIINFGLHNHSSGPDFLECQIKFDGKIWAGQIEFHVKSSDWFKHQHQTDTNYNNVIAHFVFEHDQEIESGKYQLPTVELKSIIDKTNYLKYQTYISSKNWVACQNEISDLDPFVIYQQKEKVLFNRLIRKSNKIVNHIELTNGDRQKVFYSILFKAFGTKINQIPFQELASRFDSKIISKLNNETLKVQAYLFGLAGFLNDDSIQDDTYFESLKTEFDYQKQLFGLTEMNLKEWKFAAVRPHNYPTVRLAQLTQILIKNIPISKKSRLNKIKDTLEFQLDEYWVNHYMFSRKGKRKNSGLTNSFKELLIINVYVPFLFSIGIIEDDLILKENALSWLEKLNPEVNGIISKWKQLGIEIKSAFDTQALIEQKNEYCSKSQCIKCKIGQDILKHT